MPLTELKNWWAFIQDAPVNIRSYLQGLLWLFVALLLVWAILKLLFNQQFKQLYAALGAGAKLAGQVGKEVAKGAAKSLELPDPYPRVARFFAIIFMLNSYAASLAFACISLVFAALTAVSSTSIFWGRIVAPFFIVILVFFAWFSFADAERDRVRLFKRSANEGG